MSPTVTMGVIMRASTMPADMKLDPVDVPKIALITGMPDTRSENQLNADWKGGIR